MKTPRANKNLGQHFLKDKNIINKINNNQINKCDITFEIGPGPATLTKGLAENSTLYLIEMDQRFKEILVEIVPEANIFWQDALHFDWKSELEKKELLHKSIRLVSNLPYNISSQLFISFIQVAQITHMDLMFQKEVGEKTTRREHIKNQMSSLLALSETYFESQILAKLPPGAFNPPPKVDSIVISYQRKNNPKIPLDQFAHFENFLRMLFQHPRKQLGGKLKTLLPNASVTLQENNISPQRRAETLEMSEIYTLFHSYSLHKRL